MKLLRRVLYYHAAVWAACGVAIAVAPHFVLQTLFDQVPYPDVAYVRVCGAMSVGLALVMVLIAQKIEELWWWSWVFALTDAAIVTITGLHVLFGLPGGSGSLLWWIFAGTTTALAVGVLTGIGKSAQEKPFA